MSAPLTVEQKTIHFLDRTSFGVTPESVQRVSRIGMGAYLDEQLQPEKIFDDVVEEKVSALKTIRLNSGELFGGIKVEQFSAVKPDGFQGRDLLFDDVIGDFFGLELRVQIDAHPDSVYPLNDFGCDTEARSIEKMDGFLFGSQW